MVTHVMSNVVLVRGVVLYPLGLPLIFGRKLHTTIQAGKQELAIRLY